MIPIELFCILASLAVGLSLYGVWNLSNRIYANIILGGMASSILWFFLAALVITGDVFYDVDVNEVMIDTPLFWLMTMFGACMLIYTLLMSVEAIRERNVKDVAEI